MLTWSALIVACLASFRAIFAQKNRESEAEEARKREVIQREASNSKTRAMWARAKYFQQSLLESMHGEGPPSRIQDNEELVMQVPLKNVSLVEHGLLDGSQSLKAVTSQTNSSRTVT